MPEKAFKDTQTRPQLNRSAGATMARHGTTGIEHNIIIIINKNKKGENKTNIDCNAFLDVSTSFQF